MKWFATGAYGRAAKLEDWLAGKDFKFFHGPYFSIRDKDKIREGGCTRIEFIGPAGSFVVDLDEADEQHEGANNG